MRDNPLKDKEAAGTSKDTSTLFAGDNFERYTGDATEMARLQLFAWDATAQSSNVHIQANPSQAELMYKQHLKKKTEFKDVQRDSILEKYGGGEHLKVPPRELLLAQTENYVEYSQTGRLIKGQERAAIKSKYQEDM